MTQRFWIPANFYYTRLSQESVELVFASDYDAMAQELEALKADQARAERTTPSPSGRNSEGRCFLCGAKQTT